MSTLTEIRAALVDTVGGHVQKDLYGYQVVDGMLNLPALVVRPSDADFAVAMNRGTETWELDLIVLVSRADDETSQDDLDEFVSKEGPNSIRQAIFNAPDLGLGDVDAFVKGMRGYGGEYQVARVPHVGAVLKVVVQAF